MGSLEPLALPAGHLQTIRIAGVQRPLGTWTSPTLKFCTLVVQKTSGGTPATLICQRSARPTASAESTPASPVHPDPASTSSTHATQKRRTPMRMA